MEASLHAFFGSILLMLGTFTSNTVADQSISDMAHKFECGLNTLEKLVVLNEENWRIILKGEWMVKFFAPWCPACKSLLPVWERFATSAANINVNVAQIDVTTSPSLSGRFFVTALPTIYHVKDGEFRQYHGSRESEALILFLKRRQWQTVDPTSAWKKPDTIHMSVLSYFFKLSHILKDFNSRLQDEYGLPTWGSYGVFATGTIFVGAALGLMLVCIVDLLYPPKKSQRQSSSEEKEMSYKTTEDIANDEIEDDVAPQDKENENNYGDGRKNENYGDEDNNDSEVVDENSDNACTSIHVNLRITSEAVENDKSAEENVQCNRKSRKDN